jgi:hypothetical protein
MVDNSEISEIQFVSLCDHPKSDAYTGSNLISNSQSVSIVKSTRRRTTLEVVIPLKRVKPAYHPTPSGSGTNFGNDAKDQVSTKGQAMKEGRDGGGEGDQDYDGDVEMNEDEMVSCCPNSMSLT